MQNNESIVYTLSTSNSHIPLLSSTPPFVLDISLLPHLGYTLLSDIWWEQARLYSPLTLEIFKNKISPNVKYIIKQNGRNMYKK
jgi:hypothetical protein